MRVPALYACALLAALLAAPTRLSAATTQIDVVSYRVRLTIEPDERYLEGVATVTFRNVMHSDLRDFTLELRDLITDKVEMEGMPLTFTASDSAVVISLDVPLRSLDTGTVTIWYHGNPTSDGDRYAGVRFGPRSVWAHPQSHTARYVAMLPHWLPCNNMFSDKAIFDLTFDTPTGWRAASMGTLVHESEQGGRLRTQWVLRDPLHPAGAGWSIGDYEVYRDTVRGIPLCAYVWPAELARAEKYFQTIDTIMAVFEQRFGPYPAEKIGFALTDSNSCEVQTMIVLRKDLLTGTASTLEAHELAHHWWGNTVTPMDIRENWLSEGFAMFGEWLLTDVFSRNLNFDDILRYYTTYYRERIAPTEGALPLFDYLGAGARYNYPSVIYIRGAVVLNMLRHWMGDDRYWEGIRDYFSRCRGMNVSSIMFREVMEEHFEQPLEQYFNQWVYTGGWPMLRVVRMDASPAGGFRLAITQRQQDEKGWPLFETPIDVEVVTMGGKTLVFRRMLHALAQDQFVIDEISDVEVASWRLDPKGWLLHAAQLVTSVGTTADVPEAPLLEAVYPLPLLRDAAVAMQAFSLPRAGGVTLEVHDMLGRRVRTMAEGWYDAGRHVIPLDLTGCAAGHYRLLLRTAGGVSTKVILLR